jgi:hypothetical protein
MDKKQNTGVPIDEKALLDTAIPIDAAELGEESGAGQVTGEQKASELAPVDLAAPVERKDAPKIRRFGDLKQRAETFVRAPNKTGHGAIHVKTFVAKLRLDSIEHMDQQINEWLDAHPEYEVKFVSASTGELKEKLTEPALFLSVWV